MSVHNFVRLSFWRWRRCENGALQLEHKVETAEKRLKVICRDSSCASEKFVIVVNQVHVIAIIVLARRAIVQACKGLSEKLKGFLGIRRRRLVGVHTKRELM